MTTLLYVSGPMTGFPQCNFPAFEQAAQSLRHHGYRVLSPHDLGQVDGWSWDDYMRRDLLAMLSVGPSLGGVATLPDGPDAGRPASRGRALEIHVATELGIAVMSVKEWLARQLAGDVAGGS